MKIIVLYSLPTPRSMQASFGETDIDTEESAKEVLDALISKKFDVELLPIDQAHIDTISSVRADLIFNLIEWTGLDMYLADRALALIEASGIPFTGATRDNYITTADKSMMKKLFDGYGLPTARWQLFETGKEVVRPDFIYPLIVKPALEHCSIGLTNDAIVAN